MQNKKIIIILSVICIFTLVQIAYWGYKVSWGPLKILGEIAMKHEAGNADEYDLSNVAALGDSPLKDKKVCFLGSSVTLGYAAQNVSFADYIGKRNSSIIIKEAVNGTTLTDIGSNSYIQRMKSNLDSNAKFDLFVCQLSTNDASQNQPLGEVSNSFKLEDFDTSTVIGSMEYIICYAKNTWNCPVVFYTETRYDSSNYPAMVEALLKLKDKWGIGVIDLWNNNDMNNISKEKRKLYMHDNIHPTKAGYLEWWTPVMEEYLYDYLKVKQ